MLLQLRATSGTAICGVSSSAAADVNKRQEGAIDGRIDSLTYSDAGAVGRKGESLLTRLFR